jgi:hypothetical protein
LNPQYGVGIYIVNTVGVNSIVYVANGSVNSWITERINILQTGAGNRARVDGGGGIDTLKLEGEDLTLDLTNISDKRIQDKKFHHYWYL